jgi:hypothetical protein
MRVLLDENLDWRLKRALPGHDVHSISSLGWAGIQNGKLLRQAVAAAFDVLVTMDNGLAYQQDLSAFPIAVLVLRAHSNRLQDTLALMPILLRALPHAAKGVRTIVE